MWRAEEVEGKKQRRIFLFVQYNPQCDDYVQMDESNADDCCV